MIVACPKCKQRHDVEGRRPGETLTCACGNVVAVPEPGKPKSGWQVAVAIVAAGALPCIGTALVLLAIALPSNLKFQMRSKQGEAKVCLKTIRDAELVWFAEHGEFMAAGPVPSGVPSGGAKARFDSDAGFTAIGWKPEGDVRFQYAVVVTGPKTATITARGDLDGNGKQSEFRLMLVESGEKQDIQELTPNEH